MARSPLLQTVLGENSAQGFLAAQVMLVIRRPERWDEQILDHSGAQSPSQGVSMPQ
jgi:hypothetical protein